MDRKILTNRYYLYLTEFFAGMSVMAVELGASRLLAPYFSSSQIVWTIIIGTIMIAMALGNLYGGRYVDKNPNPDILYRRIMVAAIWIALIPVVGKYLIIFISGIFVFTVSHGFLVVAAFAACMIVFVFPLFLLGTVTPSLVKFTVESLDDSGSIVGKLNAFNTIGSIIGTFVPTFISIPLVGTNITFLIFAGILLLLSIVYFVSSKRPLKENKRVPISILIFLICCILGNNKSFAFWQTDLIYEGESIYNYLQVYEDDSKVVLSTNVLFGVQSMYLKDDGFTGMYYDYALLAPYMAGIKDKSTVDILILGNGSGTYAVQCRKYFDNTVIDGVEIDEKITRLAGEYFELPRDINVVTYDGRAYLAAVDRKYDVIMVDAYQDITIPFQMSTVEFFTMVKEHLNPDGVMVVNMNMRGESTDSINYYLADTISRVFDYVYTDDVKNTTNVELFASDKKDAVLTMNNNIDSEENHELKIYMRNIAEALQEYTAGDRIMTDDKAPVELLGMKVIDELIEDEVRYYKEIYKAGGIRALIESLTN